MEPADAYLYDVQWSPVRPLVFAVADGAGKVHVYDLGLNTIEPVVSFLASSTESDVFSAKASVVSLAFNSTDGSILAGADGKGVISVWSLSSSLSTPQEDEYKRLEALGSVEDPK